MGEWGMDFQWGVAKQRDSRGKESLERGGEPSAAVANRGKGAGGWENAQRDDRRQTRGASAKGPGYKYVVHAWIVSQPQTCLDVGRGLEGLDCHLLIEQRSRGDSVLCST